MFLIAAVFADPFLDAGDWAMEKQGAAIKTTSSGKPVLRIKCMIFMA
jgi:hypothetical protein